jgi:hypothetical protein
VPYPKGLGFCLPGKEIETHEFAATCFRSASTGGYYEISWEPPPEGTFYPAKLGSTYLLRMQLAMQAGKGLLDVLSIKASPIWIPEKKGEEYDRLVEGYFGVRGLTSWRGFVEDYGDFVNGAKEAASSNSSEGITISW